MNIHEFARAHKHFFWSTRNYDGLNNEAVVEATLNYGDMDDIKELIAILGMKETARIFREQTSRARTNYQANVAHYFKLYFQKYA